MNFKDYYTNETALTWPQGHVTQLLKTLQYHILIIHRNKERREKYKTAPTVVKRKHIKKNQKLWENIK